MNNNKKIIIGILALVVTCVIGYALFSETVSIKGTAKADGDFNISLSCETGIFNKINLFNNIDVVEAGYNNDICEVKNNEVFFKTNLEYFTASRAFTVKVTNNGTIDITLLENSKLTYDSTISFVDNNGNLLKNAQGQDAVSNAKDLGLFYMISDTAVAFESNGIVYNFNDPMFNVTNNEFFHYNGHSNPGDMILKPGKSAYFVFQIIWPETDLMNGIYGSASGLYGGTDKFKMVFDGRISFPFQQAKDYE